MNAEGRRKPSEVEGRLHGPGNAERGMAPVQPTVFILHSTLNLGNIQQPTSNAQHPIPRGAGMQKGEWLPFSRLFSFCILHSAFCILHSPFCRATGYSRDEMLARRIYEPGMSSPGCSVRPPTPCQQFSLWTRWGRRVRSPGLQGGGVSVFRWDVGRVPHPAGGDRAIVRTAATLPGVDRG